jgi:hypothetical protein
MFGCIISHVDGGGFLRLFVMNYFIVSGSLSELIAPTPVHWIYLSPADPIMQNLSLYASLLSDASAHFHLSSFSSMGKTQSTYLVISFPVSSPSFITSIPSTK